MNLHKSVGWILGSALLTTTLFATYWLYVLVLVLLNNPALLPFMILLGVRYTVIASIPGALFGALCLWLERGSVRFTERQRRRVARGEIAATQLPPEFPSVAVAFTMAFLLSVLAIMAMLYNGFGNKSFLLIPLAFILGPSAAWLASGAQFGEEIYKNLEGPRHPLDAAAEALAAVLLTPHAWLRWPILAGAIIIYVIIIWLALLEQNYWFAAAMLIMGIAACILVLYREA